VRNDNIDIDLMTSSTSLFHMLAIYYRDPL